MMNDYEQNNQYGTGREQTPENTGYSYTSEGAQPLPRSGLRFGPSDSQQPNPAAQNPVTMGAGQPPVNPVTPPTAGSRDAYTGYTAPASGGYYNGYQQAPGTGERNTYPGYGAAPGYTPPEQPTGGKKPRKEKKKKSGKGVVVAIAIVCLIFGLGVGGGAMWLATRNSDSETVEPAVTAEIEQSRQEIGGAESGTTPETEETGDETAQKDNPAINSTTIEITTNSDTTSMTPQSVYEHYVNAVVAISNEGTSTNIFGQVSATASSGSGMIISKDGYILTNNHVVEGAERLTVTMTNGEEYEATLVGADSDNDVALIKIEGTDFPTVSIGDSDSIQVGEQLCAIGNPLGELTNTLTVGYVSALDREIDEDGIPINMFQTDCAINSGNSGGPIFDMNGNVVGVTTAKYSASLLSGSASIEGIGFCIPINDAMDIVNDLLQYGYVRGRVSMGIMCQAISSTVTQYYNLPAGIYISSVESGSAAEKAGLVQGDIICAIDDVEVLSVTDLKAKLKEYAPGDTATLQVYRNETHQTEEVDITFDEMMDSQNTGNAPENDGGQQNPFAPVE